MWTCCGGRIESLDDFKASGQGRGGIPFLGPWANRLDEQAFYANGRRFPFDMEHRQRSRRPHRFTDC